MGHRSFSTGFGTLCDATGPSCVTAILLFTCFYVQAFSAAINNHPHVISDGCDWNGSGLEVEESDNRIVQPVYLRCREGRIQWQYPKGALRAILRLPDHKEFKACLMVRANYGHASFYIEGSDSLVPLIFDGRPFICFMSRGGHLALLVEANSSVIPVQRNLVHLSYDLQPISADFDECRPCTEKELLHQFCASDFAVRGSISGIENFEALQRTELIVRATEVLRDSPQKVFTENVKSNNVSYGTLHRPLHCGTKPGHGEFLFLGRWKLDSPMILCAPRWREWKKVKHKAIIGGSADCLL